MRRWKLWLVLAALGVGAYVAGAPSYVGRVIWERVVLGQAALPPVQWEEVKVRPEHPRLYITRDNLAEHRQRLNPRHPAWSSLVASARQGDAAAAGLCYQMTGEREFAQIAARSLRSTPSVGTWEALAFDWAFPGWDKATQAEITQHLVNALGLREGRMPFVSSYCDLNRPLPSQTPEHRWHSYYNWTFHSEDWAECSQLGGERYSPYFALAGHHPQATRAAQAMWEMSFKDAALFLEYLKDGAYWEGFYWSPRAKMGHIASVFAITTTSLGLGKEALPFLRNFGYFLLYQTDLSTGGIVMPYGDAEIRSSGEWQVRPAMLAVNFFARNPYYQWYLNHKTAPMGAMGEALWYDPRVPEKHPRALPPTHYFPQSQVVMFRSGWEGRGDCIGMFRVGKWFDIHNHYDAGHFMLYKDGFLVGKSEFYGPKVINAINHNTFALEAPGVTDGGQRHYRRTWSFRVGRKAWMNTPEHFQRGKILKFVSEKDYDYVAADVTPAYPSENVKEFTRQLVFLRPGALVIFDRVKTAPQVSQKFLAHVVGPPTVRGEIGKLGNWEIGSELLGEQPKLVRNATVTSQGAPHVLVMRTLLPQQAKIRAVQEGGYLTTWRVEVAAAEPQTRNYFLHLLYPADAQTPVPSAQMNERSGVVGLEVRWRKHLYRMTFRKDGKVDGRVEVKRET